MKKNDAELIRLTLDGDETAFTELVNRYKKAVHALVWRKIEDFHIAEELTQDVFLKAYQKLGSLKKPQSFASWLYVSASRRCIAWQRKKRLPTIPFDETKSTQRQETAYSQYVVEEKQRIYEETQRDVVKQLLAKLPESERTVITLHYFSEMSSFEIGTFLGVSANTVRSRLRRAQKRLQKEEPMIREALEHFQISPNITDNIMREVSHLKPTPPGSKPIVPWIVAASSAVIIALMLGIGSQFLAHFQKPYSLDAQAETKIEFVDSSLVLNLEKAADTRNQIGRANVSNSNNINGQKQEDVLFAAAQDNGVDVSKRKQQWISETPINGSPVFNLLATPEGEIYALGEKLNLYKYPPDGTEWQFLCDVSSFAAVWATVSPMGKWKNTLYILAARDLFASTNNGRTWDLVHKWNDDDGPPNTIVGTEQALYVALGDGIFRTEDDGKTWKVMNDGLNERLVTLIEFQNILFAGTEYGLFRLNGDSWERLNLPDSALVNIRSLAAAEEKLYVATEFSFEAMGRPGFVDRGLEGAWRIYRSVDLGDSWTDITPKDTWSHEAWPPPRITLLAAGETLIAIAQGMVRSTDGGDTWLPPSSAFSKDYFSPAVALNESLFYVEGQDGLHRSTDQGNTWLKVNIPQERERSSIADIIVHRGIDKEKGLHPTLFARYGNTFKRPAGEIALTEDSGNSWQNIQMDLTQNTDFGTKQPTITHIVKSNGDIYAKGGDNDGIQKAKIYRVSQDDKTLVPVQEIPIIDGSIMAIFYQDIKYAGFHNEILMQENEKKAKENSYGAEQFFKQLNEMDQLNRLDTRRAILDLFWRGFWGPFAIGNDTFYMEYNFKLFRWMPGETEWYDTGLEETVELTLDTIRKDLILAVSGDTVYVGKRDGHLVVSFDKGNNWTDLTPALPFHVNTFKDIVVDGMKAYVATDAGIIRTDEGRNWFTVTDSEDVNLIMEHLAVDKSVLYGVTEHSGIYRLENGSWKQVVSNTPESVTSLAVSGDTIYVGTAHNEMLHYILEE